MFYVNGQQAHVQDLRREAEERRAFDEAALIRREKGGGLSLVGWWRGLFERRATRDGSEPAPGGTRQGVVNG